MGKATMDSALKHAIELYVRYNEPGISYPDDFADGVEEYLLEQGFDVTCIVQYNDSLLE